MHQTRHMLEGTLQPKDLSLASRESNLSSAGEPVKGEGQDLKGHHVKLVI